MTVTFLRSTDLIIFSLRKLSHTDVCSDIISILFMYKRLGAPFILFIKMYQFFEK